MFEDCGNCIAMEQSGYISIVKTGSKEQKNKMQGVGIMNKKEIKLSNGCDCHSKKWKGRTCTAELGGGKGSFDRGGICQIRCCFSGTSEKNIS